MTKNFKNWLINNGYKLFTGNNQPSTVFDYLTGVRYVCQWEGVRYGITGCIMNKITILNDKLRQNIFNPGKDRVILTQGVSNLPFDEQLRILLKVKRFNNFNSGNAPYSQKGLCQN